jgi:hypothetical protein
MDDCCSVISGRLTLAESIMSKGVRVWAEDADGGRVVAQSDVGAEGDFRMGGITAGRYRVFARSRDGATEELSTIELGPVDQKILNKAVTFADRRFSMELVGLDGRLSESAATVSRGGQHVIFVGGKGVSAAGLTLSTNSPYFHIDSSTVSQQDVKGSASVISFSLKIDAETPPGVYSLFASAAPNERSVLIGAIRVR